MALLAELMVFGVADFASCGDVSSFYSGLRIRLRVHAPQGSCPSMGERRAFANYVLPVTLRLGQLSRPQDRLSVCRNSDG